MAFSRIIKSSSNLLSKSKSSLCLDIRPVVKHRLNRIGHRNWWDFWQTHGFIWFFLQQNEIEFEIMEKERAYSRVQSPHSSYSGGQEAASSSVKNVFHEFLTIESKLHFEHTILIWINVRSRSNCFIEYLAQHAIGQFGINLILNVWWL